MIVILLESKQKMIKINNTKLTARCSAKPGYLLLSTAIIGATRSSCFLKYIGCQIMIITFYIHFARLNRFKDTSYAWPNHFLNILLSKTDCVNDGSFVSMDNCQILAMLTKLWQTLDQEFLV